MNGIAESEFLNVRETAELLGVHENTVRNWVRSGRLHTAKLPGTSVHRFERSEVLRLKAAQGKQTVLVSSILRAPNPGLIGWAELNAWANSSDANVSFPDLLRRLLALTPGISNLSVRAYEGVAAPGWDGKATSTHSKFLPSGELRFEMGTTANPKQKAQEDYDKRVEGMTEEDAAAIFVAATPRNWAGHDDWATERAKEEHFAGVRTIDAHVLEQWLVETPSVHYWISERLGFTPLEVKTLEGWWQQFSSRSTKPLPPALLLAGRQKEVEELKRRLNDSGLSDQPLAVKAGSSEEALGFLFAALDSSDLLQRVLVVASPVAWQRLLSSLSGLILVPTFDKPDIAAAFKGGHRVLVVAGADSTVRGNAMEIPKIHTGAGLNALHPDFSNDLNEAQRLVTLARRSFPAFLRRISRNPTSGDPEWVKDVSLVAIMAPLALIGSWTESSGDLELVVSVAGHEWDQIQRTLRTLARSGDAPFIESGGVWRLASPSEAALRLFPSLTSDDITRWRAQVPAVLLDPNPFRGLDRVARLMASRDGRAKKYSAELTGGFAQGLALLAVSDVPVPGAGRPQTLVDGVVRELLQSANTDPTAAHWELLSPILPSLAEASPEELLNAINDDLDSRHPLLEFLFQDREEGLFGPSSPHTGVLWALETLCWPSEYFQRSAYSLARLAAIDPGGKLKNRPLESLKDVLVSWTRQTLATVDEKLDLLRAVLRDLPDIGWLLVVALWPESHAVAMPPHPAKYRDWSPSRKHVSINEWVGFVNELTSLGIEAAGTDAERWAKLVTRVDDLPPRDRQRVRETLRATVEINSWSEEQRYELWGALRAETEKHRSYPEAVWVMPESDVDELEVIAGLIAPVRDPRRFAALFDWRPRLEGLSHTDLAYDERLIDEQRKALQSVLEDGIDAVEDLVCESKAPYAIGRLLAENLTDQHSATIATWLDSDSANVRSVAQSWAYERMVAAGFDWLLAFLQSPELEASDRRLAIMPAVPSTQSFRERATELDSELEQAYWRGMNLYRIERDQYLDVVEPLLSHTLPWSAVSVLANALHDHQTPSIELVKEVVKALMANIGGNPDPQMGPYYVQQLMQYFEQEVPDDEDLPGFEFFFFPMLDNHEPSRALYKQLGSAPDDFVNLVSWIYRAEGERKKEVDSHVKARANIAWTVLHEWRQLPGTQADGSINGNHLAQWVRDARIAFAEVGRARVGDEHVGQILSGSPAGTDGLWPAEPVREIIETAVSVDLETGIQIGEFNSRGVISRDMHEGGTQERALEAKYRSAAAKIDGRWRRTARMLRAIADNYGAQARREDAETERWEDG